MRKREEKGGINNIHVLHLSAVKKEVWLITSHLVCQQGFSKEGHCL